jgi:hypothetical protein
MFSIYIYIYKSYVVHEMAENDQTYQELLQQYTAQSLHEVYREGTVYRVRSQSERDLQAVLGFEWTCSLSDYDKQSCTRCARRLTSIAGGERWVVDEARLYWCGACKLERPRAQVQHLYQNDASRKVPRQLKQVLREIQDHPSVLQLNNATRQMLGWLAEEQRRSTDDNRYIRDVWSFLYKGISTADANK